MASVLTSPTTATPPQRFIIDGVTWEQYVKISDALTPQHGLRLTYDGARLELMTLWYLHEHLKKVLGYQIATLAFDLDINIQSGALGASRLGNAGEYEPIENSLAFPFLRVADLQPFLLIDPPETETKTVRRFRDWLREQDFQCGD